MPVALKQQTIMDKKSAVETHNYVVETAVQAILHPTRTQDFIFNIHATSPELLALQQAAQVYHSVFDEARQQARLKVWELVHRFFSTPRYKPVQ
jgi:hypothetical protein